MACFHPATAFYSATGKGLTFSRHRSWLDRPPVSVPCNQCIGCRLDRAQDWATRLHHEASLHEDNQFLTLTFAPEHMPWNYSVSVRDVQLFMKRYRKAHGRVRFFACGEYGDRLSRPHYHVMIFGHRFADLTAWRQAPSGHVLYRSAQLEKLWPFGHCEVGSVTRESAGYVARYVVKKVTGRDSAGWYERVDSDGIVRQLTPEFIVMSNRPGIGAGWYDRYASDAFPSDFLIIDGSRVRVPRYYAKKLEEKEKEQVSIGRRLKAHKYKVNNTPERLAVREELQELRAQQLKRGMESE